MKSFDVGVIAQSFYQGILSDDDRPSSEAYVLIILPAVFALISVVRPVDESFISTMSTTLAILFGFTFSSLLTTAKYSAKEDRLEKIVVNQARVGTSYALLVNLISLIAIVVTSILVIDYSQLSGIVSVTVSAVIYYLLFHYLLVMVYLMRYLYLLAIGGAFAETTSSEDNRGRERDESEISP